MTIDISSESATIRPKKRSKTTGGPSEPTPKAPKVTFEAPPNSGLHNRSQAPSRTSWVSGKITSTPHVQTSDSEAVVSGIEHAGEIGTAVDEPVLRAKVSVPVENNEGPTIVNASSTLDTEPASVTALLTNIQSRPTASQTTGNVSVLEEAGSKAGNIPIEIVSRSTRESVTEGSTTPEPDEQIQILDLHTTHPLISFQKQLYSCAWTTTIGTDLLLTPPSIAFSDPLLKHTTAFNILAASGIKMLGRPVRPIAKQEARFSSRKHGTPLSDCLPNISSEPEEAARKPKAFTIPVDTGSSIGRQNQAHFLERLMAIKAAKGEKDSVTVYAQKTFTGTGWRTKQRADREAISSDEDGSGNGNQDGPSIQVTPRGSLKPRVRRRMARGSGKPRVKSGLFRDYTPRSWDGAEAINGEDNSSAKN